MINTKTVNKVNDQNLQHVKILANNNTKTKKVEVPLTDLIKNE